MFRRACARWILAWQSPGHDRWDMKPRRLGFEYVHKNRGYAAYPLYDRGGCVRIVEGQQADPDAACAERLADRGVCCIHRSPAPQHGYRPCRRRKRTYSTQAARSAHIADEVLHPNPGLGPHHADSANERAAHVVGPRAEDMPGTKPYLGLGPVPFPLPLAQQPAALALPMDAACRAHLPRQILNGLRPAG